MKSIKFVRLLAVVVMALFYAYFAQAAGTNSPSRVTVTGSSTIAPLMSELAKAYEVNHRTVKVDVQSGGTSRGIMDVRRGTAQIGMVSRALYDDEKDLQSVLIARDGISMIVHKSNPVQKLSRDQIIEIYSGKIKNWQAVGGVNLPIVVISKAEGRSTLEIFTGYFGLTARNIRAQVIIGDNQQEIQTIANNPGAIGYVSIGSAEYESRKGSTIKLVQLDNLVPSSENVAKGLYPITRELNLVFRTPLTKEIQGLIDFAVAPEARNYIAAQYFIPVEERLAKK